MKIMGILYQNFTLAIDETITVRYNTKRHSFQNYIEKYSKLYVHKGE